MAFDDKCVELAKEFVEDSDELMGAEETIKEDLTRRLAKEIQESIDDWLAFDGPRVRRILERRARLDAIQSETQIDE